MLDVRAIGGWAKHQGRINHAVRYPPWWYGRARRTFLALAAASMEQRRLWTEERLSHVLGVAARSAYGRECGGTTLDRWPVLEKATVLRKGPQYFAPPGWRPRFPAASSGTTGTPLKLWRSWGAVAAEQAALDLFTTDRSAAAQGPVAVLRGDVVKPASDWSPPYSRDGGEIRVLFSSHHLTPQTVGWYRERLAAGGFSALWAYPTSVVWLAQLLRRQGLALTIPRIITSSEVMTPEMRRFVAETLHGTSLDYYGQAERVALAVSDAPELYYFLPGYAHIELFPVGGDATCDYYEVVGTGLWNAAMPLVRYRTGDKIAVRRGEDASALHEILWGVRPFLGVVGRQGQYVLTPEGGRVQSVDHIVYGVPHLLQAQLVQTSLSSVSIRVIVREGFGDAEERRLLQQAYRELPSSMEICVERVPRLEAGPNGKTPFVVRQIQESPMD